jgi:hypothetical protein
MITRLVHSYLKSLQTADYATLLSLFAADAMVISPLYGKCNASEFYKDLFADTQQSEVTLIEVFKNTSGNKAAFLFQYNWTLADGSITTFDCVDVMELNEFGKIKQLQIIYDTAQTRVLFNQLKS